MRQFLRRQILELTWLDLINNQLPQLAKNYPLPIKHNHCFARCIFDNIFNQPWNYIIDKPAYKHISDQQLEIAIIMAEQILKTPSFINHLNHNSLQMRNSIPLSHTLHLSNNT